MDRHYILNVILVCFIIILCVLFIDRFLISLGYMLIGNRGSTCFSGIWRPDQLPVCVEGILFYFIFYTSFCLESVSII
jgi:hypothetical protein